MIRTLALAATGVAIAGAVLLRTAAVPAETPAATASAANQSFNQHAVWSAW